MAMNNRQYTDDENAKKVYETFNRVYTTGQPDKGFHWELIRKDGSKINVEASVSLRKDSEGQPIGFRGVARDVSERRQAEQDKARLEAQLQQAQKMEAIGTLAGGIAHDFNNLLMAIQGRASIMLMSKDSSHPDFDHLKGIEEHIKSAADLTRQLLGFARGGKYEVRPTDLNELIKKQNRMFARTKKEININSKYEENLWSVDIDRGQIEQVLLNLYVNAWQAMPGGGNLYLETENVTLDKSYVKPFSVEPGKYVKISVTDTGVGIDKATQKKIFDPFFTTKELGYKTLIARGGKEAVEIYENNKERIDIVVLDMIMPDMSGSDTYDRMKEIDPHIKVLLASGYSINGQATEILDRGCNGFIQKPFKVRELSQKLREILDNK